MVQQFRPSLIQQGCWTGIYDFAGAAGVDRRSLPGWRFRSKSLVRGADPSRDRRRAPTARAL